MEERKLFFKSDFKLWEWCHAGYSVPFRFRYYTNSPKLAWEASFDGHEYVNCKLMEDGRLCVAFDDHKLGLGLLKVERRYYLTDEDYQTDICDEVLAPAAVVCWDGIDTDGVDMDGVDLDGVDTYNIRLSLEGAKTLSAHVQVPPYYQKGDRGKDATINGYNAVSIEGDAVKQQDNVIVIDTYTAADIERKIGATATALGNAIGSVATIATSKQDKLIAGDNIRIAPDGRTISAVGGGGGSYEYYHENTEEGTATIDTPSDVNINSHYAIKLHTTGGELIVGEEKAKYNGEPIATEEAIERKTRILTIDCDAKIKDYTTSVMALTDKYAQINVTCVVGGRAEMMATILPSTDTDTGWLYEYLGGWRLCKVDAFVLTNTSTFMNLCDYMDGHSAKIVSKALTGDADNLATTDKSNIVNGVNEIHRSINTTTTQTKTIALQGIDKYTPASTTDKTTTLVFDASITPDTAVLTKAIELAKWQKISYPNAYSAIYVVPSIQVVEGATIIKVASADLEGCEYVANADCVVLIYDYNGIINNTYTIDTMSLIDAIVGKAEKSEVDDLALKVEEIDTDLNGVLTDLESI